MPEHIDQFNKAKDYILARLEKESAESALLHPTALVICGSGLGGIAKILRGTTHRIPYGDIPGFRTSTVPGHDGSLLFGHIGDNKVPVMCMVGRLHFYEGYSFSDVTFPVRVASLMKIPFMIATNACGGVNRTFKPGDLMVISDHINLAGIAGNNPLRGANLEQFGPRFPALSDAYDLELRLKFFNAAKTLGIKRSIHEGVYTYACGPTFETRAECRLINQIGGDVAGMSTVPEIIVARHCGIRCFGLSLVTNNVVFDAPASAKEACEKGLGLDDIVDPAAGRTTHEEVLREGKAASEDVNVLMEEFVNTL